jgi:dTDP-4-dehydrorhamnose reductase
MTDLELWGGVECTLNRVGDRRIDQQAQSGHSVREEDLDRMAALGIRTWRYPLLWEHLAPDPDTPIDWGPWDRRMEKMRALGLEPIAGLVHHGSGPSHTSLLDPRFPEKLAEYAAKVAERYPWIQRWTPVNEPLSTARFSALDGHWYPHRTSVPDFARALVGQCRGIALAMRAIRAINPSAELVFTEDVCRHSSTPGMAEEAAFRNARRLLPMDLVWGRVVSGHPFHHWLRDAGIPASELDGLASNPTPAAILGANYYVTSDRFIDERPERVPPDRRFEGELGPYGETESVRRTAEGIVGHRALLGELWDRYGVPVAITEVHLGCTREEQVRWLLEAWDGALAARADGVDVRAVTAWGAFGLFGWDKLVTRDGGSYEPGLWDVRGPVPRPTALAKVASDLAAGRPVDAPWGGAGWWRRPTRHLGKVPVQCAEPFGRPPPPPRASRPLLVTGAGAFAREVRRACEVRGLAVVAPGRALDVCDLDRVRQILDDVRPWGVFHAVGVRGRAAAEREPKRAETLHSHAPGMLAAECAERGIRMVALSSSLVVPAPGVHDESAPVAPRSVLGLAQAEGERRILERHERALILRCGVLLGLDRSDDPLGVGLGSLLERGTWTVPTNASVVVAALLAGGALDLLVDGERGVWHVAHRRPLVELARAAARFAGLDPGAVRAVSPAGARLTSMRGHVLPACGEALRDLVRVRAAHALAASVAHH